MPFFLSLEDFPSDKWEKKTLRRDNLKIERDNLPIKCVFSFTIYKLTSFWLGITSKMVFLLNMKK